MNGARQMKEQYRKQKKKGREVIAIHIVQLLYTLVSHGVPRSVNSKKE